jgi:hypothetical protein
MSAFPEAVNRMEYFWCTYFNVLLGARDLAPHETSRLLPWFTSNEYRSDPFTATVRANPRGQLTQPARPPVDAPDAPAARTRAPLPRNEPLQDD